MKRLQDRSDPVAKRLKVSPLDESFYKEAEQQFQSDPKNVLARNAVVTVGGYNAALDSTQANNISHVFLNTLKTDELRATNQGNSGRCWMFAGLNVFRNLLMRSLKLENFEFSETYLFFYDKLERANYFLQFIIDNPEKDLNDRTLQYLLSVDHYLDDGGYWNFFTNLVYKYGLVPKEAMEETYTSGMSGEINHILQERILSCAFHIKREQTKSKPSSDRIAQLKKETLRQVYSCLVKFLGEPPKQFTWSFRNTEKMSKAISHLTPISFSDAVLGGIDVRNFVAITNIPGREYYRSYRIRHCSNMVEEEPAVTVNLPIYELKKYAAKSLDAGVPVWFAGDVSKGYCYHKAVLAEELYNTDLVFGEPYKWTKEDKLKFGYTQGCHAMTLVGVNYDNKGVPIKWQVENSWGYYNSETPGLDGFMTMTDQWFDDNLVQIIVHKQFLTRNVQSCLSKEIIDLELWDYFAPAIKIRDLRPRV